MQYPMMWRICKPTTLRIGSAQNGWIRLVQASPQPTAIAVVAGLTPREMAAGICKGPCSAHCPLLLGKISFVHWYNHEHRHSAIRFVTPAERHAGQDSEVLAKRDAIYAGAKRQLDTAADGLAEHLTGRTRLFNATSN